MLRYKQCFRGYEICLIVAGLLQLLLIPQHARGEDGSGATPFPAGYDWPADKAVLETAVQKRDVAAVREHAWKLFAGINQPAADGLPVWWTWPTETQVFEGKKKPLLGIGRSQAGGEACATSGPHIEYCSPVYDIPQQTIKRYGTAISRPDFTGGRHFQFNGDILIVTESFSPAGAEAIAKLGYDRASALDKYRQSGSKNLDGLPDTYIVTKHMFWPVKADGYSALPVWDGLPEKDWNRYNGYEFWNRFVAIDPSGSEGKKVAVSFLYGVKGHDKKKLPTKTVTAETVSIKRFFHYRVSQPVWDALNDNDRAIIDAASRWAHGRAFEIGDYLVSVAMHVNTREIPSWTLQSAWWSDRPDSGPESLNRPQLAHSKGPWRQYLITASYGIPTAENSDMLPVSYNPYIELAASHPVGTNCRNCHLRAAWPRNQASYLAADGPGPLANISESDAIFDGLMLTDFQWIIADRVK